MKTHGSDFELDSWVKLAKCSEKLSVSKETDLEDLSTQSSAWREGQLPGLHFSESPCAITIKIQKKHSTR